MSTEHQQYSTENQMAAIQEYASKYAMEIVRTFADYGKSGLDLAGREGLRTLIQVVESGNADFDAILVYDISRWGRFQDADESAYYEYICKRAHVTVHYCAEQFSNDGSLSATLLKTVKRTMAGEYSRELSVKVFAGQSRLIELGFRQGGPAGYGLRRVLQDQHGHRKGVLTHGERKSIQTDRVILVPGPADEVQIVQEIYDLFTAGGKSERIIAELLNVRGLRTYHGRPWTRGSVHQILTNPKYTGDNVYNRRSFKLKKRRVTNPPDMWIRRDNAFHGIVSRETFTAARAIILNRHQHYSNDEMLELLRRLFLRHGTLSGILIDESDDHKSRDSRTTPYRGA
jgi:DNA invertase Pin-like site-specific DNA recombinase